MRFASLALLPALTLGAQTPKTNAQAVHKAATRPAKPAPKPLTPKEAAEAQNARVLFGQVLDSVNAGWFGEPYRGVNAADVQGSLSIALSAQAVNAKVAELSQGQIKGNANKAGKANLKLRGTYFANGDFKTDMSGDFGNLLYTRIGRKGFLYSKELNAYTTRIAPPPADAPQTFFGWFRQVLNEIQSVYVSGSSFKAWMGPEDTANGRTLQTIFFNAPTSAFDPKKREQSMDDTLDFWKKGRLELSFDKATKLPYHATFTNVAQGVNTQMDFSYSAAGRLESLSMKNQSRGMEGPGSLTVNYGNDGLINHISGNLSSQNKAVTFDLSLTWGKDRKSSSIFCVFPPGANKKGKEELESLLLVSLAGELLDLQRSGLNLRSVSLTPNK